MFLYKNISNKTFKGGGLWNNSRGLQKIILVAILEVQLKNNI